MQTMFKDALLRKNKELSIESPFAQAEVTTTSPNNLMLSPTALLKDQAAVPEANLAEQ